ncbi:hypothetical protein J5N97_014878 [Dioscorea zingiberensis]|uniref:Uncharacterized protein n=1 Tax=Dioscorea zingiberensis TaxID=325984 RepID=A0A9D5CUP7_9LILI|nr:hypothetical protein J5N97_014878 [Dioscorea zingiberensis]
MARGAEGNEFVEKEEIREDLGKYCGDFTGATFPEGLDPGVPEVEDMAVPYGKQMSGLSGDFSMSLGGWQVMLFYCEFWKEIQYQLLTIRDANT